MTRTGHCSFADCGQAVVSSLEGEELCREHFISVCYTRLDLYSQIHHGRGMNDSETELKRRFVHECLRQSNEIEQDGRNLDPLERALLVHIMERASDLGRHLRRSPRKATSISVSLCCDKVGAAWEEKTETVLLSRYGASLRCGHPAEPGETVEVVRSDTGQKAHARVAWQLPSGDEGVRIGVEFVGCDNFWGLDWTAVEEAR
jgi:hypothetical protein